MTESSEVLYLADSDNFLRSAHKYNLVENILEPEAIEMVNYE